MENVRQLIESYLNSRSAILRAIDDKALSFSQMEIILNKKYDLLHRRRRNPAYWRPDELVQLADVLLIPTRSVVGLEALALQLKLLPGPILGRLLREAQLDSRKLTTRRKDYCSWQYSELIRLAQSLSI